MWAQKRWDCYRVRIAGNGGTLLAEGTVARKKDGSGNRGGQSTNVWMCSFPHALFGEQRDLRLFSNLFLAFWSGGTWELLL